jgi:hypothetical protein
VTKRGVMKEVLPRAFSLALDSDGCALHAGRAEPIRTIPVGEQGGDLLAIVEPRGYGPAMERPHYGDAA